MTPVPDVAAETLPIWWNRVSCRRKEEGDEVEASSWMLDPCGADVCRRHSHWRDRRLGRRWFQIGGNGDAIDSRKARDQSACDPEACRTHGSANAPARAADCCTS